MNRLQSLDEPVDYLVTLNGGRRIDPASVLRRMVYEHPVYTPASVAAQRRLPELTTGRTAFAGAYHGWGFHEDGCASGVRGRRGVRGGLVSRPDWTPMATPALYDVAHRARRARARARAFEYRGHAVAGGPRRRRRRPADPCGAAAPLAGGRRRASRRADHLGDPARSIKENVVDVRPARTGSTTSPGC